MKTRLSLGLSLFLPDLRKSRGMIVVPFSIVVARVWTRKSRRKFAGIFPPALAIFAFPGDTIFGARLLRKIFRAAEK